MGVYVWVYLGAGRVGGNQIPTRGEKLVMGEGGDWGYSRIKLRMEEKLRGKVSLQGLRSPVLVFVSEPAGSQA